MEEKSNWIGYHSMDLVDGEHQVVAHVYQDLSNNNNHGVRNLLMGKDGDGWRLVTEISTTEAQYARRKDALDAAKKGLVREMANALEYLASH